MTFEAGLREAFVWIWLPGALDPVVAGRLAAAGPTLVFNYGQSYLTRRDAIPLYEPELPLRRGALPLPPGLSMPGCIRDSAPDAWGRRVILNRLFGRKGAEVDTAEVDELTYLLHSGSDRIGALDFQVSATRHDPRQGTAATLDALMGAAGRVEDGIPLDPDLDQALLHGSSIGGARPKATIEASGRKFIAKFPLRSDAVNVVKWEFVCMQLAALAGLRVAPVALFRAAGKDVLLVERFDRERSEGGWRRKAMVSALTMLGLDEMMARYASYEDFASIIRHRFAGPRETLREVFGRISFNILCGNTDDHARNHSAFWDGSSLSLTPAYDICPQARAGGEASQAMLISGQDRRSRIATCLGAAAAFLLSQQDAEAILARQIAVIRDEWPAVRAQASLTEVEANILWRRQILNPYVFEGAPPALAALLA